jgi:phosphoribosyl 1,2-cyclic phosphodiesterase
LYLLISHFHWDHIQGFPFFEPAYQPGNKIEVWSGVEGAEQALSRQMSAPFFPMRLEGMGADISFHYLPPGKEQAMGDFGVSVLPLVHPGGANGFKLSTESRSVVYFTDTELFACSQEQKDTYRKFVDGCNLLIADTQYERREAGEKMDWGHSSATAFIDLVRDLGIESLVLFHYDPKYDDEKIDEIFKEAALHLAGASPPPSFRLLASYEGLEIQV